MYTFIFILSCPKQLKRWPCHSLTDSLTQSGPYKLTFKEQPKRIATFETFDQSVGETWPDLHLNNLWHFWLLLTIFLTISTIFQNFDNLSQFLTMFTIYTFFYILTIFYNLWQLFWQFWQLLRQLKRQSWRLVIFETLITIENLNSGSHCFLTHNCDTGQHLQFLRCSVS